jgi:hypothetical protein
MGSESETAARWLATLTHARLRAEQGDASGARSILQELLERDPADERARELLGSLPCTEGVLTDAEAPNRRRAIERLEAWLRRLEKSNGEDDV